MVSDISMSIFSVLWALPLLANIFRSSYLFVSTCVHISTSGKISTARIWIEEWTLERWEKRAVDKGLDNSSSTPPKYQYIATQSEHGNIQNKNTSVLHQFFLAQIGACVCTVQRNYGSELRKRHVQLLLALERFPCLFLWVPRNIKLTTK